MNTVDSIFSVSQLNLRARQLLEISFASVRVEGEISNLARPSSGHWYFTLKDANAQVRCAMFRSRTALLKFQPKEGDKVEVRAKVSLYEGRGDYQLIVDSMKPAGEGALLLAFQRLKERLQLEGLFDPAHKQTLPQLVKRVGVVTSSTGAALHDILTVLKRRDPSIEVFIYPSQVQGKEATAQIIAAIERANRDNLVDVLIVGRGGGSLEDLWCFNEEPLARAMFASKLPIISAVGHEVDFTIADFVADLRAPTPSAAAELVSQDQGEKLQFLAQLKHRLWQAQQQVLPTRQQQLRQLSARLRNPKRDIEQQNQRLDQLEIRLVQANERALRNQQQRLNTLQQTLAAQHPKRQLAAHQQSLRSLQALLIRAQKSNLSQAKSALGNLPERLLQAILHQQQQAKQRLANNAQLLQSVSPLSVLARGYAITQNQQGQVVQSIEQIEVGEQIHTQLNNGWISSQVTHTSPTKPRNLKHE